MAFAWSNDLKIGIPQIDAQHMSFFECQKILVEACRSEASENALRNSLGFLEKYAKEHFRDEEAYMCEHHCAKIDEHIKEHEAFVKRLDQVKTEYEEDGISKSLIWFVDQFLLDWITTHIMSFDQSLKWCRK